MAHEIDTTTGRAAVFVTGTPAWHGLGAVIQSAATSAEAIGLAGLDWDVEQKQLFAEIAPGVQVPVPNRVANVRTDTNSVLGVVSPTYRVFQNAEAFDFMDAIVGDKLAMYDTAGSLKGGKRVWMLAAIPKEYRVGDDVVKPYVLLSNVHDGTQSLRMTPTTVRVVCQNTLNYAQAGKPSLTIPHWPILGRRVQEARNKLGIIGEQLDHFGEEMTALAERKLNAAEVDDYFGGIFPKQTRQQAEAAATISNAGLLDSILDAQEDEADVVADLLSGHFADNEAQAKRNKETLSACLTNFENERNNLAGIERSAWAAYNSVSEWVDHQRTYRGRTEADRDDTRLNSIWFASGNEIKQTAYANALDLVS